MGKIYVVCHADEEYEGVSEIVTATPDEAKAKKIAERLNCVVETVEDGALDGILNGERFYQVEFHMRTNEVESVRRLPLGEPRKPDSVESICARKSGQNLVVVLANSFGDAEEKAWELYEEFREYKRKEKE